MHILYEDIQIKIYMRKHLFLLYTGLSIGCSGFSQALDFTAVQATVNFSRTLQDWDGFGFNYVETAHSSDMKEFNQEYGGFSLEPILGRIKKHGVKLLGETPITLNETDHFVLIQDPDGTIIELIGPLK